MLEATEEHFADAYNEQKGEVDGWLINLLR